MAHQARDLGQHEDRQEMPEAGVDVVGHQEIKHVGRQAPVDRAHQDLARRDPRRRQVHAPAPDAQRAAEQLAAHQPQQRHQGERRGHRQAQAGQRQRRRHRHQQQRHAGKRAQPQPEAQRRIDHHPRHLGGAEPGLDVEAVADGAGNQQRHAQRIAEGVADEGNQADLRARQALADGGEAEPVVQDHHPVAARGEQHGQRDAVVLQAMDVARHLAVAHLAGQPVQRPQRQAQHGHGKQRTGETTQPGHQAGTNRHLTGNRGVRPSLLHHAFTASTSTSAQYVSCDRLG